MERDPLQSASSTAVYSRRICAVGCHPKYHISQLQHRQSLASCVSCSVTRSFTTFVVTRPRAKSLMRARESGFLPFMLPWRSYAVVAAASQGRSSRSLLVSWMPAVRLPSVPCWVPARWRYAHLQVQSLMIVLQVAVQESCICGEICLCRKAALPLMVVCIGN